MKKSRVFLSLVIVTALPLVLIGCPKKTETVDAAPAPSPSPSPTPSQTETVLMPMEDEAGADVADVKKIAYTGPGMNPNQVRAKQCCAALKTQAKSLGNSPEANQLTQAAMVCDQVAMQLGPGTGQAPEFGAVRQMLSGKTIPPVCQGL